MDLQGSDRIGGAPKRSRFDPTYLVAMLALLVLGGAALFGWNTDTVKGELESLGVLGREDFSGLYSRLGVAPLATGVEASTDVHAGLVKLAREPCDPKAVFKLTEAVAKAGEERWAAQSLVGWSRQCGAGTEGDLRKAAALYLDLHDFSRAGAIATQLTEAHPGVGNYWYIRAKADVGLKKTDEALLSYANAIHLEPRPKQVGSWVFHEMSDVYASRGRYCDAIAPIEDYVALDPAARDTPGDQRLIDGYAAKGHCVARAAGSQSFPVVDANVIHARVTIDGATGTFALDTGASFVTVTPAFARKAHLVGSGAQRLRAMTANGAVYSQLAVAASVKVGRVEARQVPVAILDQGLGTIDGLLGRSFLSRFEVTVGANRWSLKPKAAATAAK